MEGLFSGLLPGQPCNAVIVGHFHFSAVYFRSLLLCTVSYRDLHVEQSIMPVDPVYSRRTNVSMVDGGGWGGGDLGEETSNNKTV